MWPNRKFNDRLPELRIDSLTKQRFDAINRLKGKRTSEAIRQLIFGYVNENKELLQRKEMKKAHVNKLLIGGARAGKTRYLGKLISKNKQTNKLIIDPRSDQSTTEAIKKLEKEKYHVITIDNETMLSHALDAVEQAEGKTIVRISIDFIYPKSKDPETLLILTALQLSVIISYLTNEDHAADWEIFIDEGNYFMDHINPNLLKQVDDGETEIKSLYVTYQPENPTYSPKDGIYYINNEPINQETTYAHMTFRRDHSADTLKILNEHFSYIDFREKATHDKIWVTFT